MSTAKTAFVALCALVGLFAAGCATTPDPNYELALRTQKEMVLGQVDAQANASIERSKADQARADALAAIAAGGDTTARVAAVMAIAMLGASSAPAAAPGQVASPQVPTPPESGVDKFLRYAGYLGGPALQLGMKVLDWRISRDQGDNNRAIALSTNRTFAAIANAGLGSVERTATSGFYTLGATAGLIQSPQPNITLSGTGVIGNGVYAPTTTITRTTNTNSFNTTNTTTRTCTGGNGAPSTTGTTGNPGQGGTGGNANC